MTLTIHSIRAIDNSLPEPTDEDKQALVAFHYHISSLVNLIGNKGWRHDDPHLGPFAPLLAQYRADLAAADAAVLAAYGVRS